MAFALAGFVSSAQVFLTPKVGASISKVDYDKNIGSEKSLGGVMGGMGFEFATGHGVFSFAPEILFIRKGGKLEAGSVTAKRTLNYLEIPLLARINVAPVAYLNAGPSFAIGLSGRDEVDGVKQDIKFGSSSNSSELKRFDFGIAFGGGLRIPTGAGSVLFDARYTVGLTDFDNVSTNKSRNRSIGLTLGYAIPLGTSKKL